MSYELKSVSYSKLRMFISNPENFFFRYVLGLKMPPAKAFLQGRSIHSALEENYKEKFRQRKVSEDMLVHLYEDALGQGIVEYKKDLQATKIFLPDDYIINQTEQTFRQLKNVGIKGVRLYKKEVDPGVIPLEIETKFELTTNQVPITGRIDLIDKNGWIRDHKTSKNTPPHDDAQNDEQLKVYDLAYRVHYKKPPRGVRKDYIVLKGDSAKIVPRLGKPMAQYRQRELLRNLSSSIKMMKFCIDNNAWHNLTQEKWAKSPKWNGYFSVSRDLHLYGLPYIIKKYVRGAVDLTHIGEKLAEEVKT